jgi:hypothetical protein
MLLGAVDGAVIQTRDPGQALRFDTLAELESLLGRHFANIIVHDVGEGFRLVSSGVNYMSAEPDGKVVIDRTQADAWECFRQVDEIYVNALLGDGAARLGHRVADMGAAGMPVCMHMACGWTPLPGFLNIDIASLAPQFAAEHPDEYFVLPTAGVHIPLPNDCVDYIFHEDFIEHIGQLDQISFLAETLRLLKPGGIHRVNTPNLLWTMRTRSDFSRGAMGVYMGERQWEHIAIFSPAHLEEVARMVGYREVHFNARGDGCSPYAVRDRRPLADRDEIEGNIFADLVK